MLAPTKQSWAADQQHESAASDLEEIITGLSKKQKMISPKFFYDQAGSKLFDRICELPEYYPTRTELGIMQANIDEMAELIGAQASLIEFGSGSSLKTRILLEHMVQPAAYVPVDISGDHLLESAADLSEDFPHLEILPVVADFTQAFPLPNPRVMPVKNLVYFPGSTIGNFSDTEAHRLLKVMHQEAGEDGALLIGVDLKKDIDVLEKAYNDSEGVTAAFNLNVLTRINRELGANFDLASFDHEAIYDKESGRIEMRLISNREQTFSIDGMDFSIRNSEAIITEHSHKYSLEDFREMAARAGFIVERTWTDPAQLFSVQYCVRQ